MSKFNTTTARPVVHSPVTSEATPSARTHQGGAGYARSTKGELFLLAVSNMVGEHTYYESSGKRDERYASLVRSATIEDPEWTARFLRWLRGDANMRSASLVGAAEFVKARLDAKLNGLSRQVVNSVLQRADEPGEFMAYWTTTYGRTLSMPVKRGLADAALRLYNERSLLKWDTATHGVRFADVIDLVRPKPLQQWQSDLFRYAIDRRHNHDDEIPESLRMLKANARLRRLAQESPAVMLDAAWLAEAGMTWEDTLSLVGSRVSKAALWESLIPTMGYMALLRNLRNFDEAGVADTVAETVTARLASPEQVAKSRQLPMRFLSAYRAAPSLRWAWALEKALNLSLSNVPELAGRTLVLVDRSGSMWDRLSAKSDLNRADAAAIFGTALALRCAAADLVEFGTSSQVVPLRKGESVLPVLERFHEMGGTYTAQAIQHHYRQHDRVVIVTDEQASYYGSNPTDLVPANVPVYTWNLAGYQYGHAPSGSGNRHTFGGLTDQAFRMIPLLEAGKAANWPW